MTTRFQQAFQGIERPFAWLDLDALDDNIATVQQACGQKKIRIATKSIRSVEVLQYLQQHLSNITGFMTFTAAESIFLLQRNFDDVLLGYPVMEDMAVRQLLHYVKEGRTVTFMVDRCEQVAFCGADVNGIHL
ncbi:hypothetical protein LSPH24S_08653 [Lysinibacillus sphaericus]